MIPPILMDIKGGELILDMCAAPGSKTSQIVEMLQSEKKGTVIANEVDYKRAWILTHRMKNLNFPGIFVINHLG